MRPRSALAPFVVALPFAAHAAAPAAGTSSCRLTPVMSEDFHTLDIAPTRIGPGARWTAHTPWAGDFGDARFADPGPSGPFRLRPGGGLSIVASKNASGRWTSGLLAAADSDGVGTGTRYGYFEARMRLPPGPGTWPAFWLSALKPVTSKEGNVEIDVIEYYGQFDSLFHNVLHVWYSDPKLVRGEEKVPQVPAGCSERLVSTTARTRDLSLCYVAAAALPAMNSVPSTSSGAGPRRAFEPALPWPYAFPRASPGP